jgi:hypothetical protein
MTITFSTPDTHAAALDALMMAAIGFVGYGRDGNFDFEGLADVEDRLRETTDRYMNTLGTNIARAQRVARKATAYATEMRNGDHRAANENAKDVDTLFAQDVHADICIFCNRGVFCS